MAKKIYDEKIDKSTDWGGDASTGGLPVSGRRIQEFIKESLNSVEDSINETNKVKFGYSRIIDEKYIQFFADAESATFYDKDPVKYEKFLLGMSQLPWTGIVVAIMRVTVIDSPGQYSSPGSSECFRFRYLSYYENEEDHSTVRGQVSVKVNNSLVDSFTLLSGNTYDIPLNKYFTEDLNYVEITINNGEGSQRSYTYEVNIVDLRLVSTFDSVSPYSGAIDFRYTPYGDIMKTVHFIVDGNEIASVETPVNNRQLTQIIPAQPHGSHSLEVYMTAEISGEAIESKHLYYSFISLESGNSTPIISSSFIAEDIQQYETLDIPYVVYDPASITSSIDLLVNGEVISNRIVDRSEQRWVYRLNEKGEYTFSIRCKDVIKDFYFNVTESIVTSEAETQDLQLYLTSQGRSNQDVNKEVWGYNGIQAQFSGMTWINDGWVSDDSGHVCMRLMGNCRIVIPIHVFSGDFRTTGKTIEVEFAARNVRNYATNLISCYTGNRGLQITANTAMLRSEQSSLETKFKEDERFRISFVVEKRANNRLIQMYVNGVKSRSVQYPESDNFTQLSPVGITLGSTDAILDIYNIRVYNNNLNASQLLDNYIADMDDIDQKIALFNRNQIYDTYGEVNMNRLLGQIPVMTIVGDLPQYKGDKKTVRIEYTDRKNPSKSFVADGCSLDVQGTSSQYYPRKNFKFKAKNGFNMADGGHTDGFTLNGDECLAATVFCMKADFAESSGSHNTGIADYVGQMLREANILTEPQKRNPLIRTTVYGEPCVIFHKKDSDSFPVFIGKYNFNTDKGAENTFGFASGDESWEFLNNTSDLALFKSADFSKWKETLEARYPEDYDNIEKVLNVFEWVVSCQGDSEKFKSELEQYFDKNQLLFYYVITFVFGMVDQRAKNQFLTTFGSGGWLFIFYDNDTCMGINNEGAIAFPYNIETHDRSGSLSVWNGADSELWKLVEDAFADDIGEMYRDLRQRGILSYERAIQYTNTRQSDRWCEAVYNEDGYFKYEQPLVEGFEDWSSGSPVMTKTGAYLYALQGSRDAHRRWWLYNRFKYLDSKFQAGSSLSDFATFRTYTPSEWGGVSPNADITIQSFHAMYATIKWGSVTKSERMGEGETKTIKAPEDMIFNDTETIIYNASSISSLGNLSALYLGSVDVSRMTHLQELCIGSRASGYNNTNLRSLSLGNNNLLQIIDVSNCSQYSEALDLRNCPNIEYVYAIGTAITAVILPASGHLKQMIIPGSISNLTIRNQPYLTQLMCYGYANISTFYLEGVPKINTTSLLRECLKNNVLSRVRVDNLNVKKDGYQASGSINELEKLAGMNGIDDNGNNTEHAILRGYYYINEMVNNVQLARYREMWPDLTIEYASLDYVVEFTDPEVERICLENWDTYGTGVIFGSQLKAVSGDDFHRAFANNNKIVTFHEMKYFNNFGNSAKNWTNLEAATVTKNALDAQSLFFGCAKLNDLTVIKDLDNQEPLSEWPSPHQSTFLGCGTLTPTGIIRIYYDYNYMFQSFSNSRIKEVILTNRTSSKGWVGHYAFKECAELEKVTLYHDTPRIDDEAFFGCAKLGEIDIPDSVTTIGDQAFCGCAKLSRYHLPAGISTYLGKSIPGTAIAEITGLEGNSKYKIEDGVLYNADKTQMLDFPPMKTGAFTVPESVVLFKYDSFGYEKQYDFRKLSSLSLHLYTGHDFDAGSSSESLYRMLAHSLEDAELMESVHLLDEGIESDDFYLLKSHNGCIYRANDGVGMWRLEYVPPMKTGELELLPGMVDMSLGKNKSFRDFNSKFSSEVTKVINFRLGQTTKGYCKVSGLNYVFKNVTEYVCAPHVEGSFYCHNEGLFVIGSNGSANSVYAIYCMAYPPAASAGETVIVPDTARNIGEYSFSYSRARKLILTATIIYTCAFYKSAIEVFRFESSSVPTLSSTSAFDELENDFVIVVPIEKLSMYIKATNWKIFKEKLVGYQSFESGVTLPEGYVWYSDEKCTERVESVDAAGEYYCKAEAAQAAARVSSKIRMPDTHYESGDGKVFRRIADGMLFGKVLDLGYTYVIGGEVLEVPKWESISDFEEVDEFPESEGEEFEENVEPINENQR